MLHFTFVRLLVLYLVLHVVGVAHYTSQCVSLSGLVAQEQQLGWPEGMTVKEKRVTVCQHLHTHRLVLVELIDTLCKSGSCLNLYAGGCRFNWNTGVTSVAMVGFVDMPITSAGHCQRRCRLTSGCVTYHFKDTFKCSLYSTSTPELGANVGGASVTLCPCALILHFVVDAPRHLDPVPDKIRTSMQAQFLAQRCMILATAICAMHSPCLPIFS